MILPSLAVPTVILVVATATDIKTRKIYNKWVLASIFLALLSSFTFYDFEGIKQGAAAAGLSLALTLPLVLIGVLGAGDMKILFAFALSTTYQAVFSVLIFSLLWAAAIGLALAWRNGKLGLLVRNTVGLLSSQKPNDSDLQKIPFSVPILAGWMTYLLLGFYKGGLS